MPAGSPNWITTALDRYERPLVRYTANLVGDLDVARDIVQSAFLKLCQRGRPRVGKNVAAWLYAVCRNAAIDHLRRERMRGSNPSEEGASDETPLLRLSKQEQISFLLACIGELSSKHQEVLRLKFEEGLRYKEIAQVLDTSVSNVGVMIHTAIKRLRDRIEADASVAQEGRGR